jgi:prepilin-type N-terminal cleavage/methylation domain-containing protein
MIGKLRPINRIRGFTLIELMVVVAIIALVSAAVVPAFSSTTHKNRQREAAMLIIEAVFDCRSRAVRTGRCCRVRVMTSDTANNGGFGGAVAIDESNTNSCNATPPGSCFMSHCMVAAGNPWTRVSYKSVWTSTETAADIQAAAQGDSHAGLVGEDVAIFQVTDRNGSVIGPGPMLFDPTGRLVDRTERFFDIVGAAVTRQVRVTAAGSVRFTQR